MRRLLRWTFNTLAMASLLLCLATAGLWVRSYWVYDDFGAEREAPGTWKLQCTFATYHGMFEGAFIRSKRPSFHAARRWGFHRYPLTVSRVNWTGFEFVASHGGYPYKYPYDSQYWRMPAWTVVSAFAVLPAVVVARRVRAVRRRRHRSRLGLCPACGYDLRASPERCPECGRQGDKVKG